MNAARRLPAGTLVSAAALGLATCWLIPVSVGWRLAPDLGHAWAAPVLMAYLWWERWAELPSAPPRVAAPAALLGTGGLLLVAAELVMRLLLVPFPLWPALLGAYTLLFASFALGGAWVFGGRAGLRWVGGPLLLIISTLPVPSLLENAVVVPLRIHMAAIAAELSNLLGHPAVAMGTSVRLGSGWVGIDEACGGIRSLQACVMIGLFFGEWYRFSWARRGVLLFTAVGSALFGNFARVLFLSLLANSGPHAVERAHDLAGWIAMTVSLTLTGWIACHWSDYRWPQRQLASAAPPIPPLPPSSMLRWFAVGVLALVFNEVATRAWFAAGKQRLDTVPHWVAVLPVTHPTFQPQPLVESARELLRPDYFVAGRWRAAPDLFVFAYYIEWRQGQLARSLPFLHNPTICLPMAGAELVETLPPIIARSPAGDVPFFVYRFRRMGDELLVAFTIWDTWRGRPLEKPGEYHSRQQWWASQWAEVAEARQHQPAQLLTITVPWSAHATAQAQTLLAQLVAASP